MRILIIEDEVRVASFLQRGLEAEGHRCEVVHCAADGLTHARAGEQDLIILDRMLPDGDGLALCQALRRDKITTPVLMLTALAEVDERVDGLRAGADDYLPKPFDFEELLARVDALHRRGQPVSDDVVLRAGVLELDTAQCAVSCRGESVVLTALEFDLLALLVRSPGRFWSRERILSRVWSATSDPETNIVDVYISRLRRKLDRGAATSLIETRRGVGYRLRPDLASE